MDGSKLRLHLRPAPCVYTPVVIAEIPVLPKVV